MLLRHSKSLKRRFLHSKSIKPILILYTVFGMSTKLQWPHQQLIHWTDCCCHPARAVIVSVENHGSKHDSSLLNFCWGQQTSAPLNKTQGSAELRLIALHFLHLSFPNRTNCFFLTDLFSYKSKPFRIMESFLYSSPKETATFVMTCQSKLLFSFSNISAEVKIKN